MKKDAPGNLAASVHAQLLNQARSTERSFNDLLQLYAMERFLYRLSKSRHASRFILKGALLLRVWDKDSYRTTRDIDLLGRMPNDIAALEEIARSVCVQPIEPDGLQFDAATVTGATIVEDGDYEGVRIMFRGGLGNARIAMRIDVGFGDVVTPSPCEVEFPTLLDMPAPRLMAYAPETTVAEKFQIMLQRGAANSRMKDFHDIWWLAQSREFNGPALAVSIKATCERRTTDVLENPTALTGGFSRDAAKIAQWKAFRRRLNPTKCPADLVQVTKLVARFLLPVAQALARGEEFHGTWHPPGPWR